MIALNTYDLSFDCISFTQIYFYFVVCLSATLPKINGKVAPLNKRK